MSNAQNVAIHKEMSNAQNVAIHKEMSNAQNVAIHKIMRYDDKYVRSILGILVKRVSNVPGPC